MTEARAPRLRRDVTTGQWVLFAPERGSRPQPPDNDGKPDPAEDCPFCPGHEDRTPPEIARVGDPWSVRVVPNQYPALESGIRPGRPSGGLFAEMPGHGRHEVVIESPDHTRPLAQQPLEQIERLLRMLHERFVALAADPALRAIVAFKNHGRRAGTSLTHPHWQIIATPVIPRDLATHFRIAREHFERTGRCLESALRDAELEAGARVLAAGDAYVAVLPFASHLPYQVRILPLGHSASFAELDPARVLPLARILRDVLSRLYRLLADPHYNVTIATAPIGEERAAWYLWHIDILPRMATPAGFELGSGMAINPVLPETATEELREAPL